MGVPYARLLTTLPHSSQCHYPPLPDEEMETRLRGLHVCLTPKLLLFLSAYLASISNSSRNFNHS